MFQFSEEEKDQLRMELKCYDAQRTERFITILEFHCGDLQGLFLNEPTPKQYRADLNSVLKTMKKALKHLHMIGGNGSSIFRGEWLEDFDKKKQYEKRLSEGPYVKSRLVKGHQAAQRAIEPIETLIGVIEDQIAATPRLKPGRQRADRYKFVKLIAEEFENHFTRPSTYKDGALNSILIITYDAMGIPQKHPDRRQIPQALKELYPA